MRHFRGSRELGETPAGRLPKEAHHSPAEKGVYSLSVHLTSISIFTHLIMHFTFVLQFYHTVN